MIYGYKNTKSFRKKALLLVNEKDNFQLAGPDQKVNFVKFFQ